MKYLLGNKLGMTQTYDATGKPVPVTLVEAAPCVVTFVRTKERDGYDAIQVGFGKRKRTTKPEMGHLKDKGPFAVVREFRLDAPSDKQPGDIIDVSTFAEGDAVKVAGLTKAKGFQGVVKRHGFRGGPKTHGQKHSLRAPGSIGATWPQRVLKGTRMAGRMGGVRRTVRGLSIVRIDKEHNIIAVSGALPGKPGALMEIIA